MVARADDQDFSGTVRKVFDGDSFLVRPAKGRDVDVRLQDIDAPEKDQPYGNTARTALVGLIGDRNVFVDVIETDRYGRKVVRVYREPDRLDIVKALVRDGHVWVYRRTVHDRSLIGLEDAAKAERRGLWALPESDRMPPWQYRYHQRQKAKRTSVADGGSHRPIGARGAQEYPSDFSVDPELLVNLGLERAQPGRFHQPVTPVTTAIFILPGAERGGEVGARWTIVVPEPVEVTAHLDAQRRVGAQL